MKIKCERCGSSDCYDVSYGVLYRVNDNETIDYVDVTCESCGEKSFVSIDTFVGEIVDGKVISKELEDKVNELLESRVYREVDLERIYEILLENHTIISIDERVILMSDAESYHSIGAFM